MQKMNLDTDLTPCTKINSKWSIHSKVKCKTVINILEVNIGGNLDDLGYDSDFSDTASKTQSMKEAVDKLDFTKTENFCCTEDNAKRMKIPTSYWGKNICKRHI